MKKFVPELERNDPSQVYVFKTMKELLKRFKNLQFFTAEFMDVDGMVTRCEYSDIDGVLVLVITYF